MKEICKKSFINSLLAGVYIVLVALFMSNANEWLGQANSTIGVAAVLLLFSLSALVVGGLIVGKPIFLYIDGKKKDAVWMLIASAGWLLLFLLIAIAILIATK